MGSGNYITAIRHTSDDLQGLQEEATGGEVLPGVKVSDITFAGVPVRVYEPPAGGEGHLRRGLVYFHGGGWALGSASELTHSNSS